MRNFFANALFASASIALTAGIVAASAAPAAAAVPADSAPQATVHFSDLNLADKHDRADLAMRIHEAADQVCPSSGGMDLQAAQCRENAIAQAHRDVADQLAVRSAAPVQSVAP